MVEAAGAVAEEEKQAPCLVDTAAATQAVVEEAAREAKVTIHQVAVAVAAEAAEAVEEEAEAGQKAAAEGPAAVETVVATAGATAGAEQRGVSLDSVAEGRKAADPGAAMEG